MANVVVTLVTNFTVVLYHTFCYSKAEMSRLRLQAGCCMLKLAQESVYAEAIKLEQFQTMALLASVSLTVIGLLLFANQQDITCV